MRGVPTQMSHPALHIIGQPSRFTPAKVDRLEPCRGVVASSFPSPISRTPLQFQRRRTSMSEFWWLLNIAGKRFGRLTVLHRVGADQKRHSTWRCLCECGRQCIVRGSSLVNGTTKSCGCLARELSARRSKERSAQRRARRCIALS